MGMRLLRALLNFRTEPVRAVARLTSALTALVTLAGLWGFSISDQTQTALLATASTLIVVINAAAEFMRQFVTPVPVAHEAIALALNTDPAARVNPADVLQAVER